MRRFDIIAQDAEGRDVLLVEVNASILDEKMARSILEFMRKAELPVRFGMVADLSRIRIADYELSGDFPFACVLDTSEMLREYDPEFGTNRIFEYYLTTLVEAWLRDHAYHWKLESPPGFEQLAAIGLLPILEGGDTHREVVVGTDSLH